MAKDTVDGCARRREIAAFVDLNFQTALDVTGTPVSAAKQALRAERIALLIENLDQIFAHDAPGPDFRITEAGVWRGLSAYLITEWIRRRFAGWEGCGLTLVDSFEGLSPPRPEDMTETESGPVYIQSATGFSSNQDAVRASLAQAPQLEIYAGWIPPVLKSLPDATCYGFVHLDTDLFEPTYSCLEFFLPRMVPGGAIMDDDYGSVLFPGVRKAWDLAAAQFGLDVEVLDTGQAVWRAPLTAEMRAREPC